MDHPFEPYGVTHWIILAGFVAGIVPVVRLGRSVRTDPARARRISRAAALAIVGFTLPLQALDCLPGRFDVDVSLPLQLCDLAWVVAAYALWTRRPTAVAVTYYWGLVLSSQGLVTPSLSHSFPDPRFVAFWGMHLLIVWSAIFLTWGLGIRPTWSGYARTVGITVVWAVLVFAFNTYAGTNYGYVNHKPQAASVLDLLGPWPSYVGLEVLLVSAVWALMTWPWQRRADVALERAGLHSEA
ncbi:MAG TPA: TIGR02206 family membrane protein [Nocardioides sp.]